MYILQINIISTILMHNARMHRLDILECLDSTADEAGLDLT